MLKLSVAGGAFAAFAASTCCVLPFVLGTLGLGGVLASSLGVLAPYQTAFRIAAVALLGAGFWMTYARQHASADGTVCAPDLAVGWVRPVLWGGAAILAVVLSEPIWGRWLP